MNTQVNKIEPQSGKFPQAVIWIAGIALTLFCAVGIGAVMGWIPSSIGGQGETVAVVQQPANIVPPAAPTKYTATATLPAPVPHAPPAYTPTAQVAAVSTCAECGVVESVREV